MLPSLIFFSVLNIFPELLVLFTLGKFKYSKYRGGTNLEFAIFSSFLYFKT